MYNNNNNYDSFLIAFFMKKYFLIKSMINIAHARFTEVHS